jgi:hypothetical protein
MTEDSAHLGSPVDPSQSGGNVGAGLVPDEDVEGRAEAAGTVGPQPEEGLVEPGGGGERRRRRARDGDTMSIEDQPTQEIRRTAPPAPMPGSLNPVDDRSTADAPESGSTEVLSLDDLFDGPRAPRIGAVPVAAERQPAASAGRVLGDAATAWRGGLDRSRAWITSGDNTVIVATTLIALLLLLAIALF